MVTAKMVTSERLFESVCIWLLFFCGTNTEKQVVFTTCRSKPVEEGQTAMMNISLRPQINLHVGRLFIYLRRESDPDTLRCDQKEPGLPLKCYTVNGSRFHTEGLVDHDLNLIVPNVTADLAGEYVLRVYINDVPDPDTKCVLSVITRTGSQNFAASEENSSDVTPIVVPIVIILVIIIITIGVVIFWRRKRKKRDTPELREETQAMQPGDGDTTTSTATVATADTADTTTVPTVAPVKQNPLKDARVKKPMPPTDKNTAIGMGLQQAIETNKKTFFEMKANKRGRPEKTEDTFVTAKDAR